MDRAEWVRRCANRLRALGSPEHLVDMEADTLANEQAELYGASGLAWEEPEDAADQLGLGE